MHLFYVFGPAYVRVKIGSPLRHVPITSVILRVRIRARSMLPMAERRRPLALGRPSSSSRHISSATCTHIYCHWSETGTHPYLHKSATCTQPYFPDLQHADSFIRIGLQYYTQPYLDSIFNMYTALSPHISNMHISVSVFVHLIFNMYTALSPHNSNMHKPVSCGLSARMGTFHLQIIQILRNNIKSI